MKTTKSIIVVLFVLLAAQVASAFYCPATGRWLSRDPMGEPGFEVLQAGMQTAVTPIVSSSAHRWINRDNVRRPVDVNSYGFVNNCPTDKTDFLGKDINLPPGGNPFVPWPYAPPPPFSSSSCKNAAPETGTSAQCEVYGNETYAPFHLKPVSLKCFCLSAPDDDWSKQVRGCLLCMHSKRAS